MEKTISMHKKLMTENCTPSTDMIKINTTWTVSIIKPIINCFIQLWFSFYKEEEWIVSREKYKNRVQKTY